MAAEINNALSWIFISECQTPSDINDLLVDGETPVKSFKTIRDTATFTNKRIIVRDSQGITGKKVEIYSLPYSSINMWSTENAVKLLDANSEIELWTRVGHIKINLKKDIDIRMFDRLLAQYIL